MKKIIIILSGTVTVSALLLMACESKEKKVEDAKENVQDAKRDLRNAQEDLNAEYPAYRKQEEIEIEDNENRIAELRQRINTGGKPLDADRQRRINDLEARNAELRSRLYGYEKERGDWETFKRKFNSDMRSLKGSFNDSIR